MEPRLKPWLGVCMREQDGQVVVTCVFPGSPAELGGVQVGDQLLRLDKREIRGTGDIFLCMDESLPGQEVDVLVVRNGRSQRHRLVLVGKTPDELDDQFAQTTAALEDYQASAIRYQKYSAGKLVTATQTGLNTALVSSTELSGVVFFQNGQALCSTEDFKFYGPLRDIGASQPRAAEEARHLVRTENMFWTWLGTTVVLSGVGIYGGVSVIIADEPTTTDWVLYAGGLGGGMLAASSGMAIALGRRRSDVKHSVLAADYYNDSLRESLGLTPEQVEP